MFEKPFEGYELLYRLFQDKEVEKHEKREYVCIKTTENRIPLDQITSNT